MKLKTFLVAVVIAVGGCAKTFYPYESSAIMSFKESSGIIEDLTMSQIKKYTPDHMEVTDKYILYDYGTVKESSGNGGVIVPYNTPIAIGVSRETEKTRQAQERIYYRYVSNLRIMYWREKFYVVSAMDERGEPIKHLVYARSLDDAKKYVDAFTSLKNASMKSGE